MEYHQSSSTNTGVGYAERSHHNGLAKEHWDWHSSHLVPSNSRSPPWLHHSSPSWRTIYGATRDSISNNFDFTTGSRDIYWLAFKNLEMFPWSWSHGPCINFLSGLPSFAGSGWSGIMKYSKTGRLASTYQLVWGWQRVNWARLIWVGCLNP